MCFLGPEAEDNTDDSFSLMSPDTKQSPQHWVMEA